MAGRKSPSKAGRKKAGDMHPHFAGGFGAEFDGEKPNRDSKRASERMRAAATTYAIAYRLEQYKQAGKLSAMIKGHPSESRLRKIRKRYKGDILAQIPARWLAYGPADKPFVGDDWLHKNLSDGRTLAQILDAMELPDD